jgi:peptidoglycan/xylan/chitin deacetylase (PgdA/CDA1 family)
MPRAVKTSIEVICAILYAGVSRLLRRGPCRVVLLYHSVGVAHSADFRKQMAYLAEKCSVVKPSEIMAGRGKETRTVVALTFDDALVSVLENGLPILREYGLPAGVFVPTGNLGRRPDWVMYGDRPDDNETVMTEQQIAALDHEGFEISSHTVSHPVLADLDDSGLEAELVGSKRRLEEIVGHQIWGISYPYGTCDARVHQAAQKAGYEMGFTVEPNKVNGHTERLRIGRFEVSPCETFLQFKLKADGAYHVAGYLRRLKAILLRSKRQ